MQVAGYYAPGADFDPYSREADVAIDRHPPPSGAKLCFRRSRRATSGGVCSALPR